MLLLDVHVERGRSPSGMFPLLICGIDRIPASDSDSQTISASASLLTVVTILSSSGI